MICKAFSNQKSKNDLYIWSNKTRVEIFRKSQLKPIIGLIARNLHPFKVNPTTIPEWIPAMQSYLRYK